MQVFPRPNQNYLSRRPAGSLTVQSNHEGYCFCHRVHSLSIYSNQLLKTYMEKQDPMAILETYPNLKI